jgi:hypothetical protein
MDDLPLGQHPDYECHVWQLSNGRWGYVATFKVHGSHDYPPLELVNRSTRWRRSAVRRAEAACRRHRDREQDRRMIDGTTWHPHL